MRLVCPDPNDQRTGALRATAAAACLDGGGGSLRRRSLIQTDCNRLTNRATIYCLAQFFCSFPLRAMCEDFVDFIAG